MTDKTDALVAKWRKEAEEMTGFAAVCVRQCANELEALAAPAEGGQGEVFTESHEKKRAFADQFSDAKTESATITRAQWDAIVMSREEAACVDVEGLRELADEQDRHAKRLPAEASRMLRHYSTKLRALIDSAGGAKCGTCNDHGMIGGPSYYAPDEGGEPCPDCTPQPAEGDGAVDEAMVERAAQAISAAHLSNTGVPFPIEVCRKDARIALTAAAPAAPKGGVVDEAPTAEEWARAIEQKRFVPTHPDTIRLNWLEHMARNGGLVLMNGVDSERERKAAVGLGLRPGLTDRTLREAIDQAAPEAWNVAALATGEQS